MHTIATDMFVRETLIAKNAVAQQVLNTQRSTVQQNEAVIKADQANIDSAKLNLTYCHLTAPVSGRVGRYARATAAPRGPAGRQARRRARGPVVAAPARWARRSGPASTGGHARSDVRGRGGPATDSDGS